MIVLDTNVLSELVRRRPSPQVVDWVDSQDPADLVTTAVTVAEIRAGVALLPTGRRRRLLGERMEALITETFSGYVLAFDVRSTEHYGEIIAGRARAGRPLSGLDGQIAAICAQHGARLATRNTGDFDELGLTLINPWDHQPR